jgi:hypothetical protein
MKNFYYVLTFNLSNKLIKKYLEEFISINDSLVDFKVRSKLFLNFDETIEHVNLDFDKKANLILGSDEALFKIASVINPAYASPEVMEDMIDEFGVEAAEAWDKHCYGIEFFLEDVIVDQNSWMCKYEIFGTTDGIELSGNGDFVISAMQVQPYTSTYH